MQRAYTMSVEGGGKMGNCKFCLLALCLCKSSDREDA